MITVPLQVVDLWTKEPVSDADVAATLKVTPRWQKYRAPTGEDTLQYPVAFTEIGADSEIFDGRVTNLGSGTYSASFEINPQFFEGVVEERPGPIDRSEAWSWIDDRRVERLSPLGTVTVAAAAAAEGRTSRVADAVLYGPDYVWREIALLPFIIRGRCRVLFGRRHLADQAISLRNSLLNHPTGLTIGLREAHRRLLLRADGDGLARGCRKPGEFKIRIPIPFADDITYDVAHVAPAWVPVADEAPRTVEGVLEESRISGNDFPFRPWHETYDWNFILRVDPQYTYLVGEANSLFELEWEIKGLPSWAWPMPRSRLWAVGRWIYDCGHPDSRGHRTELHPLKAVASFRRDGSRLPDNAGVTRTTRAAVFIGQEGGYLSMPINDQDYAFDLPLPPTPHPGAVPRFNVRPMTGPVWPLGPRELPVEPRITPFPAEAPRALRVVIPLKDLEPHLERYGVIIHGGWTDPGDAEAAQMRHLRVVVERIFMDANLDDSAIPGRNPNDEWYVYVGVNGRWQAPEKSLHGDSAELKFEVDLDLHPDDPIEIAVCGFEADVLHDFMGHDSGVSARLVGAPITHDEAKWVVGKVRDSFLRVVVEGIPNENDKIGLLFATHRSDARGTFTAQSPDRDYRLRYRIEDR